jgi:hypothetical protein
LEPSSELIGTRGAEQVNSVVLEAVDEGSTGGTQGSDFEVVG